MSGSSDQTKPASPRRLAEAMRAGHVPISQLVTKLVGLLACLVLCSAGAGWAVAQVVSLLRTAFLRAFAAQPFDKQVTAAALDGLWLMVRILGAVIVAAWALSTLVAVVQSRGRLQLRAPDERRHSPGTATSVVVMMATLALAACVIWGQRDMIARIGGGNAAGLLAQAGALTLQLLVTVGGGLLLLGVADLAWQRWRWQRSLRMSRAELDQEARLTFGDPAVRRERQRLSEVLLKKDRPRTSGNE